MRFIHLSGLRLGEGTFDEKFKIDYREEREQAFRAVLDAAREGGIEAVFMTGDVTDHAPTEEELREMDELFLTLPKTRFFWITGEKDRVLAGDPLGSYEWKSNTQVFLGDCIQRIFVARYDLEVTGIGWNAETWAKFRLDKLTAGRKGELFKLDLSFLGWQLLSSLPYVGYLISVWVTPYYMLTHAMYYERYCGNVPAPEYL